VPLASETDALVLAGIALRRRFEGYTLVEVPARRDFYFGNLLVLDREPEPADMPRWIARHAEHFAGTGVRRHTLSWERGAVGEAAPVLGSGVACELARSIVFVRRSPLPPAKTDGVRELATDADWDEAAAIDAAEYEPTVADFGRWRFRVVREDARAGRLRMWGLRHAGALVAFAGIYAVRGLARFATPVTLASFRRRGAFRTLCTVAVDATLERDPGATIVICAPAGEPPEAIYRALGFEVAGEQLGLTCGVSPPEARLVYS